jgi:hypothetical protein
MLQRFNRFRKGLMPRVHKGVFATAVKGLGTIAILAFISLQQLPPKISAGTDQMQVSAPASVLTPGQHAPTAPALLVKDRVSVFKDTCSEVFGVSLPKTGSSSLAVRLGAMHICDALEFSELSSELNKTSLKLRLAEMVAAKQAEERKRHGTTEAQRVGSSAEKACFKPDASICNFMFAEDLCSVFPDATFYASERNVYSWIDSWMR